MQKRYDQVVCKDGFTMSVQAGEHNYCSPRVNLGYQFNSARDGELCSRYESVEVGFPSEAEPILAPYAEDDNTPTETVYGWVPCSKVALVIAKHGGMVEGEVPPGVAELRPTGWENEDGA